MAGDDQRMDQTGTPCVKDTVINVTNSGNLLTLKQLKAIEYVSASQVAIGFEHVEGIITPHSAKSGLSSIHIKLD